MEAKGQFAVLRETHHSPGAFVVRQGIKLWVGNEGGGDYIPDFRLVDYLVALPSTEECPALDGTLGNDVRLKRDLAEQGIYDERTSFYQPYKLRTFSTMGLSVLFHRGNDVCAVLLLYCRPPPPHGLHSLWAPEVVLFLESVRIGMLLFMGRSHMTGSLLSFFVHKEHL